MRRALICFLVVATAVMSSVAFTAPAAFAAGETWANRTTPQSAWRSVAVNGGVYVAVADGGADRVMRSTNGIDWTPQAAAEANSWTSVTHGESLFVAVASDGANRVMTSPDGITWTAYSAPAGAWQSVTYAASINGGTFVAVASSGGNRVMTSTDGISWDARAAAAANSWRSVTTNNSNQFVAVASDGTNRVMYSSDGASWTLSADVDTATGNWTSVTFGGSTYVAVADGGTNQVMTSTNGTTWIPRTASEANSWTAVTYGAGADNKFVAVASSGGNRVMTSDNGTTWVSETAAAANPWTAVAYDGNNFVAVADSGTRRVMTAPEGAAWTARTAAVNSWASVAFGKGVFVAVASDGTLNRVMTSTDGTSWTARAAAEANQWTSVVYGAADGLFVAVAKSGTNRVMTSPDGITWTAEGAAEANQWASVAYGDGQFVAVANSGTNRVMTSPDGVTWTARAAAEANSWTSVAYGNGQFVAVSSDGTNQVMTSPDGITWTARSEAEANQWRSATFGAATYVAVSSNGTDRVQTSTNGTAWTAQADAAAQNGAWSSVAYSSGLFVAVGTGGTSRIMTSGTFVPNVPTITSFTPASGAVGTIVTINGTNLTGASKVTFNGVAATTFTVVSPTQITATVPDGATTGPIEVTTDGGVATSASSFSVVEGAVRIWGQDELDTSIAISQAEFPAENSASAAVLARNDFFPDALAGGPLAAQENAPLLLTYGAPTANGGTLPARVLDEIARVLEPGDTVYLLGGDLAISPNVETALETAGYPVTRLWGANQFGTAVAIANEITDPDYILQATGWNFPDALSAVPAAIKINGVILLTNNNKQAPETQQFIDAHPGLIRYTIGGNLVAGGADPGVENISGQNLYDTSAAVANEWFADPAQFGVATGNNFPDALSGGVFMATGGRMGPMLLVNGTTTPVPPSIAAYLGTLTPGTTGYAFGGVIAITDAVLGAVMAAVG